MTCAAHTSSSTDVAQAVSKLTKPCMLPDECAHCHPKHRTVLSELDKLPNMSYL